MNRQITKSEIESIIIIVIIKLRTNKSQDQNDSLGNSTKHIKNLYLSFLSYFKKFEEEGALPNSFYKATITVISKPDKNATKN